MTVTKIHCFEVGVQTLVWDSQDKSWTPAKILFLHTIELTTY